MIDADRELQALRHPLNRSSKQPPTSPRRAALTERSAGPPNSIFSILNYFWPKLTKRKKNIKKSFVSKNVGYSHLEVVIPKGVNLEEGGLLCADQHPNTQDSGVVVFWGTQTHSTHSTPPHHVPSLLPVAATFDAVTVAFNVVGRT